MKLKTKTCRECGAIVPGGKQATAAFCSKSCKRLFNNRRQQRGAKVYDLAMAIYYNRAARDELGIRTQLDRLLQEFRREDDDFRAGRESWRPIKEALDDIAHVNSRRLG